MLGILVILAVSWLLLYLIERQSLLVLGIFPSRKRAGQFFTGVLVTFTLCLILQFFESLVRSAEWRVNESLSFVTVLNRLWWDFRSVLTEELVYRGALLYLLITKLGAQRGILISAVAFGIYHWFSFGIFGNLLPMFFVFMGTGTMGYSWALAFVKKRSIMLPLGLHFGWNATFNTLFSRGPLGEGILLSEGGHPISDWFSLVGLWVVPVIVFLFVRYAIRDERIPIDMSETPADTAPQT